MLVFWVESERFGVIRAVTCRQAPGIKAVFCVVRRGTWITLERISIEIRVKHLKRKWIQREYVMQAGFQ